MATSHLTQSEKNRLWRKNAALKRVVRTEGTKVCRLCDVEKHVSEFCIHRQMIGGRTHECRVCINVRQRAWREKAIQKESFRVARHLSQIKLRAKRYGLSVDELMALEEKAKGCCDICGNPAKGRNGARTDSRLHVDHCHTSGKVRGLLCSDCNRGIGIFRDDPTTFRRAADYLERQ